MAPGHPCLPAPAELAERMQVSRETVRRLEHADPGAAISAYLAAPLVLGVLDEAMPALDPALWAEAPRLRVRPTGSERTGTTAGAADGDWF